MDYKVSVIIPVYGAEKYLEKCPIVLKFVGLFLP